MACNVWVCGVVWCVVCRVVVSCGVSVVCVCVLRCVVFVVLCCGTLKNLCVDAKRLRVFIENVPVCASTTSTCKKTHGVVLNVHTEAPRISVTDAHNQHKHST